MHYAELHCKTNFSFLEGASFADELVEQAAQLKLEALAVTDRNSLCGVVRAHTAAKDAKLKLVIGAEIVAQAVSLREETNEQADSLLHTVLLYPTDRAAYGRLSRLITVGRRRAEKGECKLTLADVAEFSAGQMAVMVPPRDLSALNKWAGERHQLLRDAFGERLHVAIELHCGQHDAEKRALLEKFSLREKIPLVAANDVHYHEMQRRFLQDVLVCIRNGCSIQEAGYRLFPNGERRLKSAGEMFALLGAGSEAWIERSVEIASRCRFSLDELRYEYPEELVPQGQTPISFLTRLTWDGARKRWPEGISDKVRAQIEHELRLVEELHYEPYFLTVWDLVEYARSRNILCQGRGSAANSAVCFCIGITSVDPARSDVLFERFVSRERAEAPDIDVDFEHERREEVMQYVYEKYGRERAGIVAEVISYRPKSAARDVGKALGMSLDRVEHLAALLDRWGNVDDLDERLREAGLDPQERTLRQFAELCRQILGFPRHLSQHVGGFVITRGPLCELSPIENASMEGRTVIEWDKDDIDALGILKVDCLALGMLTCIHRCFDLLEKHYGKQYSLATIPAEDSKVYEMCCHADTIGVFQIESRAQMSMLPRLKPICFYDLVIEVSIVRPGPIQGGMVHPYLRRRAGEEPVTFPNDKLRDVLGKTMGVPLFQEQVMRLAMVAADFTPGEADQLRRAMGAWRRTGQIEKQRQRLLAGMEMNGYPREYAEKIFEMIQGFGEYGFPESHAASFALLVYASAWLKLHYPAVFTAGLLNSQPMGFYAPAQLIRDAQNHGVEVLPVDVNFSEWDCTLETTTHPAPIRRVENGASVEAHKIRLGFRQIRGLSRERHVMPILQAREKRFESISDFVRRTGLNKAALSLLANADAFGSIHVGRRSALWEALALHAELPLFREIDAEEADPKLAAMQLAEHVSEDYRTAGLSLKAHPIGLVREELSRRRIVTCAQLSSIKNGAYVRVAGIVLVRQRPETASGVIFMTIEDETGNANSIIWPKIFEKYHRVARTASTIVIEGHLQREGEVIHVVAKKFVDVTELLNVQSQSRDFR